jgi:hypothetical protein
MMTLRDERIPIHSMLHILENVNETVYGDTIHFCENSEDGKSVENRILGGKIAEGIAETCGLTA